jgi:hypothetical protein
LLEFAKLFEISLGEMIMRCHDGGVRRMLRVLNLDLGSKSIIALVVVH